MFSRIEVNQENSMKLFNFSEYSRFQLFPFLKILDTFDSVLDMSKKIKCTNNVEAVKNNENTVQGSASPFLVYLY